MTILLKTCFLGIFFFAGLVAAQSQPEAPFLRWDSNATPAAAPKLAPNATPAAAPNLSPAEAKRNQEFFEQMRDIDQPPKPEAQPWRNCIAPLNSVLSKAPNTGGPVTGYDLVAEQKTRRGMQYLLQVWRQDSKYDSKFECEVDTKGAYITGKPSTRESL